MIAPSTGLPKIDASRLLVVGDLILDEYLRGAVTRISPEAPVPVVESATSEQALGGAANVALNLAALGGRSLVCGMVGRDRRGQELTALMRHRGLSTDAVVAVPGRPTTHKLRVVAQVQHMLRIDHEVRHPLDAAGADESHSALHRSLRHLGGGGPEGLHGVIISDYQKGFLHAGNLTDIITLARRAKVPVIIDPKGQEYGRYRGAHVLTPNLHELHLATGMAVTSPAQIDAAAAALLRLTEANALLVTCGKDGMVVYEAAGHKTHICAQAREVYDVTGAGDTVIATFALAYCAGTSVVDAARLANAAAGIVVGKLGTATVSRDELLDASEVQTGGGDRKLMSVAAAQALAKRLRARQRRLVFTNGCFDLLHAGHVGYLQAARAMGDALMVGLNTDRSIAGLKGPKRPLIPQQERAAVLAALACVDAVVLFDDPTPALLIHSVLPDVLVKGADYRGKEVVGQTQVEAMGGRVVLVPLIRGHSTTGLVQTILERYGDGS